MGGKKKKCGIVYPFAAETRGSNATSLHETASNCVALKDTGVHTNPQKDAATSPPIQGRKNMVICVQEKQMLTKLNNCVKATLQTGI